MKLASIEKILKIEKHPEADTLNIVTVLGYEVIAKNDRSLNVGDLVVFIQPDTLLPETEWAQGYNRNGKAGQIRVKALRLRNRWSNGIIEDIQRVIPVELQSTVFNEGDEVSNLIGVVKYEPPAPQDSSAKGTLPFGICRSDEERWENLSDADLGFGTICDVTLKKDGQSATYYCAKTPTGEWVTGVCGRTLEFKDTANNNYTRMNEKYSIITKLITYCKTNDVQLAIRGEVCGQGIQNFASNPDAKLPVHFSCYGVFDISKHEHCRKGSKHYFINFCKELELPTVTILESDVTITPGLIKTYSEELTQIDTKLFEGVVLNKLEGRVRSYKIINKHYDSRK